MHTRDWLPQFLGGMAMTLLVLLGFVILVVYCVGPLGMAGDYLD